MQPEGYAPPPLDQYFLFERLITTYPGHRGDADRLISRLIEDYINFWRLLMNFPDARVVGTGPIIAVWKVHAADRDQFRTDCMNYFRRFIYWKDVAWKGETDLRGTIDTCRAFERQFNDDFPPSWVDMVRVYQSGLQLRIV